MNIQDMVHPIYAGMISEWTMFRTIFAGGSDFINAYLKKFSIRENDADFKNRLDITYAPTHAKAAVTDIKNSIYQRMVDVSRINGPESYRRAINENIDLDGNTMTGFIGRIILPDLLSIGKIGICIDKQPTEPGMTRADTKDLRPYIYSYAAEDIRSWAWDSNGKLSSLLLREYSDVIDKDTGLTVESLEQFRLMRVTGNGVQIDYYTDEGIFDSTIELEIPEIPFIITEISQSLLTDVASYQIALLNLGSSDMNYSLKSNFPFYTEQYLASADQYLRTSLDTEPKYNTDTVEPTTEGTAERAATSSEKQISIGSTQGRRYPKGLDRPGFINPSSEPLVVSMSKQKELKAEVRELVNLNLASLQSRRASAESKQEDTRGKEEGLSYIGLELEYLERRIGHFWSLFEGNTEEPVIKYPQSYSLKSDSDRRKEAEELNKLGPKLSSKTFQKHVAKQIIEITMGSKVSETVLQKMNKEIEESDVIFIDPETIEADHEAGFVSTKTASELRGYRGTEVEQAKIDHAERLKRIAISQAPKGGAARGLDDLGAGDDGDRLPTNNRGTGD